MKRNQHYERASTLSYDALNRQTTATDALNKTTTTAYDNVGNIASVTDTLNNKTSFTYDELNRRKTETNLPLNRTRSYTYDSVGNLLTAKDGNNRTRKFVYDQLNRSKEEQWLNSANTPIRTISNTYDAAGQLKNINDPDASYALTYDVAGNLETVDNAGTPNVPNVLLKYAYNNVNNPIAVTDTISGQLRGTKSFTYDDANRVTRITQSGNGVSSKRVDMSYDAAGQVKDVTRYSDLNATGLVAKSEYVYDRGGRLTRLSHGQDNATLANYIWSYDSGNRVTGITSPSGSTNYSYDKRDQLTGASYSSQSNESYSYDDNGTRTNSGYQTGSNNQLKSDGVYNYQYDGEGNLTKRTDIVTGEVTEYSWDYRNRLTFVVGKNGGGAVIKSAKYSYDGLNRRIVKEVDADGAGSAVPQLERFVYDGQQIALTFDGSGNQTHRYLYGVQTDQILADEGAGSVLWPLTDNLGTVRDLVDSNGVIQNRIGYDSFGKVTGQTNPSVGFLFGFTGRELDSETGNYYYNSRYYDPKAGRFISEDTVGFAGGDVNLYRYVGNSPTNATDPFGLASTNLTKLLNTACPGSTGVVCDKYPEAQHYSQALATARAWFYAITTSIAGTNMIKRSIIPRTSPTTLPRWVVVLPLKDDTTTYPLEYRGKANLRPGGQSGGFPTIDLAKDDNRETHNTPGYAHIIEIKFKYKGKENKDPKPACPPTNATANDREAVDRLTNHDIRHPQTRPGGKPVPAPTPTQPSPTPTQPSPTWEIPFPIPLPRFEPPLRRLV